MVCMHPRASCAPHPHAMFCRPGVVHARRPAPVGESASRRSSLHPRYAVAPRPSAELLHGLASTPRRLIFQFCCSVPDESVCPRISLAGSRHRQVATCAADQATSRSAGQHPWAQSIGCAGSVDQSCFDTTATIELATGASAIPEEILPLLSIAVNLRSASAAIRRREQHRRMARPATGPVPSPSTTMTCSPSGRAAAAPAHRASQPAYTVHTRRRSHHEPACLVTSPRHSVPDAHGQHTVALGDIPALKQPGPPYRLCAGPRAAHCPVSPSSHSQTHSAAHGMAWHGAPTACSRLASPAGARVGVAEMPFGAIASDTVGGAGGTCVLRGCVPKKLFVYAASFPEEFKEARGFGCVPMGSRTDNRGSFYLLLFFLAPSQNKRRFLRRSKPCFAGVRTDNKLQLIYHYNA